MNGAGMIPIDLFDPGRARLRMRRFRAHRAVAHGLSLSVAIGVFALLSMYGAPPSGSIVAGVLAWFAGYRVLTRSARRRWRILADPISPEIGEVLDRRVAFYRSLDPDEQARFREEVQLFIEEKWIVGAGAPLNDSEQILVGAAATIPVFGFPGWEWDLIRLVLVGPRPWEMPLGSPHPQAAGFITNRGVRGVVFLSLPDLEAGFEFPKNRYNTGIHEFAHAFDMADGSCDGIPWVGLDEHTEARWRRVAGKEIDRIRAGRSDFREYGGTSLVEFFAVASEYFFEDPGRMRRKHPEIHFLLRRIYRQDVRSRFKAVGRALFRSGRPKIGRNAPCPCGSEVKFKKCCLIRKR